MDHLYCRFSRHGISAILQRSSVEGHELTQMPLANQRFLGLVSSKESSQYSSSAILKQKSVATLFFGSSLLSAGFCQRSEENRHLSKMSRQIYNYKTA